MWRRNRGLRNMLSAAPQTSQDRHGHLIAGEKDGESIFLQLVIYATRAGWFKYDAVEESEVLRRFRLRFRKAAEITVARLRPAESGRSAEINQILDETWKTVMRTYSLPGSARGFSRHVWSTIPGKVRVTFPPNLSEVSTEKNEIEEEEETTDLKKRNNVWTDRRSEDQGDDCLTPKEVAARTGVKERMVFKLIERREISTQQRAGNWLIPLEELESIRAWQARNQARLRRSGLNKIFKVAWAEKQNIPLPSAATQIHRLRAGGVTEENIRKRIGNRWVKAATQKAAEFLTKQEYEALFRWRE